MSTADNDDRGFLYIATGRKFVEEAAESAKSLRQHMPDARICCVTDEVELAKKSFDLVQLFENPTRSFFDKMPPLLNSPFKRTIFVDTDTLFLSSMMDVFDLLTRFELAAVPDPFWCEYEGVPSCFMQLNTGLIGYQNTERVRDFINRWIKEYHAEHTGPNRPKDMHDQPSFQKELYKSDLRFYSLPPEYNLRVVCPQMVRLWGPAKMLHARHPDLVDLGRRLHSNNDVRVIWPNFRHFLRSEIFMVGKKQDAFLRAWAAIPKALLKLMMR